MEISVTEENYLKAIYSLSTGGFDVSTTALSEKLNNSAASVSDMLKKLSAKKLLHYQKYKAVSLSKLGEKTAKAIVRKHRLWEVFLLETLKFGWDEVHEIAEQLEHIRSEELIRRLDIFLGKPRFDPHGDPIPDHSGSLPATRARSLFEYAKNGSYVFVGVNDHSPDFLRHLSTLGLKPGERFRAEEHNAYDGSFKVRIGRNTRHFLSQKVASNILVKSGT
ncbi:MAG TPA: metal-dependent transcriptional regulator [Bacteroidia bacterium]|nr:metal-dependent transcriptional regulator [Bacteroidia bacterium]